MLSVLFIGSAILLSGYYLFVSGRQAKTIGRGQAPNTSSVHRTIVIPIRIITIIVAAGLFFTMAVHVEPVVAFVAFVWLIVYPAAGIQSISLPFSEQSILYGWSANKLAPFFGISIGVTLLLLTSIAFGAI